MSRRERERMLNATSKLYTKRPHQFRALGERSITCVECGEIEKHTLHTQWDEIQQAREHTEEHT